MNIYHGRSAVCTGRSSQIGVCLHVLLAAAFDSNGARQRPPDPVCSGLPAGVVGWP